MPPKDELRQKLLGYDSDEASNQPESEVKFAVFKDKRTCTGMYADTNSPQVAAGNAVPVPGAGSFAHISLFLTFLHD